MAAKRKRKRKTSSKSAGGGTGRRGRGKGGINKSDFIRSLPSNMPAREVVAAGKAKGLSFSQQLVYNVRAGARRAGGGAAKGGPARKAAARGASSKETQFRQLVVDLGVTRARSLLDQVDHAMRRVVSGG